MKRERDHRTRTVVDQVNDCDRIRGVGVDATLNHRSGQRGLKMRGFASLLVATHHPNHQQLKIAVMRFRFLRQNQYVPKYRELEWPTKGNRCAFRQYEIARHRGFRRHYLYVGRRSVGLRNEQRRLCISGTFVYES